MVAIQGRQPRGAKASLACEAVFACRAGGLPAPSADFEDGATATTHRCGREERTHGFRDAPFLANDLAGIALSAGQ